jgi:alpha-glucosidase (family GH31 glycosyl hydrolase)
MRKIFFLLFSSFVFFTAQAQETLRRAKTVKMLSGETWFGAAVNEGYLMPFKNGYDCDLRADVKGNQAAPLLLSTQGRYIWSEAPFHFTINNDEAVLSDASDSIYLGTGGNTLAAAYKAVSARFFSPGGKMPDTLLFSKPQYNTWIELIYNQNQADILKYAHAIVDNGFPAGVLMIDDNWASFYGKFEFRKDRFPDARKMINELHSMGFKVMIWVCPFISPDTEVFRYLKREKLLLFENKGDTSVPWERVTDVAIVNWWNGYSAVMDFTNPNAVLWYQTQLDSMKSIYNIDGFKFDAGDPEYYRGNTVAFKKASPNEHTSLWGTFGLNYPLNEYRAMWKRGGEPLAERLRDKSHSWEDLQKLIPNITVAGLLGYPFSCPDMIGGGEFTSFNGGANLDEELVVRSAQCSALMPMMQFSAAPWRVLRSANLEAVKKAVSLRMRIEPYIMRLARDAASTGEPIVRNMEYEFPNQGFENCKDQFMLGDEIMVTPMLHKGVTRKVNFPRGTWQGDDGILVKGPGMRNISVPIDRLPWYRLLSKKLP